MPLVYQTKPVPYTRTHRVPLLNNRLKRGENLEAILQLGLLSAVIDLHVAVLMMLRLGLDATKTDPVHAHAHDPPSQQHRLEHGEIFEAIPQLGRQSAVIDLHANDAEIGVR